MSYTPNTDFLALLRSTSGGVRTERMPGLDYVVSALARAGLITVFVGQTAPTVNQSTTVWFQPAIPSWTAEGAVFLWNPTLAVYQVATPALWSLFLSGAAPSTALPLQDATPAVVGTSTFYARADHVHPTDATRAPVASPVFTGNPQAPTPTLGDNSQSVATSAFVQETVGTVVPLGGVVAFAGTAAPTNYAILNGQAISRTTFAALFAILGITFGGGDGVTTFNLPDLRGRVVAGIDGGINRLTTATMSSQALGGVGGLETAALTAAQIPTITSNNPAQSINVNFGGTVPITLGTMSNGLFNSAGSVNTPASSAVWTNLGSVATVNGISVTSNNTGSTSVPKVQPTMELQYLIRVS